MNHASARKLHLETTAILQFFKIDEMLTSFDNCTALAQHSINGCHLPEFFQFSLADQPRSFVGRSM